jgi:VCBS repeat-containing protein
VKWRSRAVQGQVTLTLIGENDPPVAGADYLVLDERSGVTDITGELLENDADPDEDETATLRIVSVMTNGLPGTLTFSNGRVTYLPPTNLALGKDQYTNFTCQYAVQDVHGQVSSNAVLTFYIVGDNSAPVAGADSVSVDEDSGAVNLTALLLANDTDADPGETATLAITSVSAPGLLGQLTLAGGIVTYDPSGQFNSLPAGSNVVQTFRYTVQDVNGAETTALVTLTVTGANDPPSAAADALAVLETAGPTNITALLLANDRDVDAGHGATLAISAIATSLTRGLVTLDAGIVRYSANGAFNSLKAGATTNDLFHYVITDVQGGRATGAVTVTIMGVSTTPSAVNNLASQTVQYSDAIAPVTITGSDPDSAGSTLVATTAWRREGETFTAGLPDGLTLTPSAPQQNSRDWTLAGMVRVAPGTYAVRVEIADEGGLKASTDLTLLVKPEDARATFTGALFASTASVESGVATVTLAATIQDITALPGESAFDSNGGDIRNARVTFINRDNNTIIASNLPVGLVATNNLLTGTVVFNWNVNIGTANSQSFTVGIVVGGHYTRNASDDNTVVTVSKPMTSDFVTGGGYLVVTRSSGLVPGGNGTKANFGFNVKYNKSGQNLQGSINLIVRDGSRVYQIKGTAMTSLSLSGNRATFNGKATIRDITDPLAPLSLDGNATLQVKMTDNGSPGSTDTIAVTVWNKNGGLWFASNWDGKKTVEQLLDGGNLEVHSGGAALIVQASAPPSPHPIRLAITLAPMGGDTQPSMGTPARVCLITFEATPDTDYALEYSTDMVTWTNLGTVTSYTGTVRYFDEALSEGFRAYRARGLTAP